MNQIRDDINWKTFEGMPYRGRLTGERARVTLLVKNEFYLNGKALDAIGRPKYVHLMYEPERRLIGIRPADPARRNAFPVRAHPSGKRFRISAAPFCRHFGIKVARSVLFDQPELRDRTLVLDLNDTTIIGKPSRDAAQL